MAKYVIRYNNEFYFSGFSQYHQIPQFSFLENRKQFNTISQAKSNLQTIKRALHFDFNGLRLRIEQDDKRKLEIEKIDVPAFIQLPLL
jgi:hypothetical protein